MKKALAVALSLTMVFTMAGCGSKKETKETEAKTEAAKATEAGVETEAGTEKTTSNGRH